MWYKVDRDHFHLMYSYRLVSKSNVFSFNLVHRSNSASLLVTGGAIRGRFTHFCFIDNAFYVLPSTALPLLSHSRNQVYHQIDQISNPSASHKSTSTSTICGNDIGFGKHASSLLLLLFFDELLVVSREDVDEVA